MAKLLRIGFVLVREGTITGAQLENILQMQKKHPQKTVGEIAAQMFSIPENEIETIFADKIMAEAIRQWFYYELSKKIPNLEIHTIISDIVIIITSFTRKSIAQKTFTQQKDKQFHPDSEKKYLSEIHCTVDSIVLKTNFKEDLVFSDICMVYNVQEQKVFVENESIIVESKIKLQQLMKKFQKIANNS